MELKKRSIKSRCREGVIRNDKRAEWMSEEWKYHLLDKARIAGKGSNPILRLRNQ